MTLRLWNVLILSHDSIRLKSSSTLLATVAACVILHGLRSAVSARFKRSNHNLDEGLYQFLFCKFLRIAIDFEGPVSGATEKNTFRPASNIRWRATTLMTG